MIVTRRAFLGGGAKVAAALFVAPAIVKAENIMKIWVPGDDAIVMPEEKQVIEDYRDAKIDVTVSGLQPGANVALFDANSYRMIAQDTVHGSEAYFRLIGAQQRDVIVRVRKRDYRALQSHISLPLGTEHHLLHMQLTKDNIY